MASDDALSHDAAGRDEDVVAVVEGVLVERTDDGSFVFEIEDGVRIRLGMPQGVSDPKLLETPESRPLVRFEIRREDVLNVEVKGALVESLLATRETPFVFAEGGGLAFETSDKLEIEDAQDQDALSAALVDTTSTRRRCAAATTRLWGVACDHWVSYVNVVDDRR